MGQKTNPIGNRLGIIRGWDSNWFGGNDYGDRIAEDYKIRRYLEARLSKGGISRIFIERTLKLVTVTITTARPGLIIGKGGQEVDKLKEELKKITDSDIDRILEKMRLMLTQNGKIALKGILQKEERQERFKDLIFKAFPVESKNICQLRYEVEKSLNDTKTLNEIRKELNSQIDLLIKK